MLSVKPWRTEAVIFLLVAQFTCIIAGGLAINLLQKVGIAGFKTENDLGYLLIGTLSFQGITWILMPCFYRFHGVRLSEGLGFAKKKWPLALLLAFGVMIVILPAAYGLNELSTALMKKMHWKVEDELAVTLVQSASSRAAAIYLGFFAVILAPVAEEFIFRGVLFPYIKQFGFTKTAWIVPSLLFALIHGDPAIFLPLFLLAMAFTWLYQTTDCLLAPVFGHVLFNTMGLIAIKSAT
jgi:membrane protease YdiL (CAAX protease family)